MSRKKKLGIVSLAGVLAILFIIRVFYVNLILYPKPEKHTYALQQEFSFHNLQICSSTYQIYSGTELVQMYSNEISELVDEQDLLLHLEIQNSTKESQILDLSAVCMQYDEVSGGNLNPFLFSYFNQDESAYITLEVGESKTVTMVFPYFACHTASLVFSLYPESEKIVFPR